MSEQLPAATRALPVFKVLYRNTERIHARGGKGDDTLHPVEADAAAATSGTGEQIREASQ